MIGQRWIVVVGVVVLSGCGGSELRRALNDIIDQREAGAAEQAEIYESFEAELADELMAEWGATPDEGCPELEDLPEVPWSMSAVTESTARGREILRAREAFSATWVRNVPAEHCRCLQQTVVNVTSAVDRLVEPNRFEEERVDLSALTEEELPLAAPMVRASADQYAPDRARERVADWRSQRHGEDGEPGWQSAAEQVDRALGNRALGMLGFIFGSCDRF